jgi:hypothetical protein
MKKSITGDEPISKSAEERKLNMALNIITQIDAAFRRSHE